MKENCRYRWRRHF